MALNPSGVMSIGGTTVGASINLELGLSATANSSIGQTNFRELAKVLTGAISLSDFYGKSNVTTIDINANHSQYILSPAVVPDYVAGETKVQLNIGTDVYLFSTNINVPALLVEGFVPGDEVTIVNDGYIMGMGGQGGQTDAFPPYAIGEPGGPAISLAFSVTIENNRYIAGGGGGGSGGVDYGAGGGGAGGGKGGNTSISGGPDGGAGGGPGMAGQDGQIVPTAGAGAGGGGGRILPGIGGAGGTITHVNGFGGGAGGGGGAVFGEEYLSDGGAGGTANIPGYSPPGGSSQREAGAGGGGWGASGGASLFISSVGGKAIALNGNTATRFGPGFYYGAIS
jgi:hypothetical protein